MNLVQEVIGISHALKPHLENIRDVDEEAGHFAFLLPDVSLTFQIIEDRLVTNDYFNDTSAEILAEANNMLKGLKTILDGARHKVHELERRDANTAGCIYTAVITPHTFRELSKQLTNQLDQIKTTYIAVLDDLLVQSNTREQIFHSIKSLSPIDHRAINDIIKHHIQHENQKVAWLRAAPDVWHVFPKLRVGQLKYIFYLDQHLRQLNPETNEGDEIESRKLQLYLEQVDEIPAMKEADFHVVADLMGANPAITLNGVIDGLNRHFQGKRYFNFFLILGSELFTTTSPVYNHILKEKIAADWVPSWKAGEDVSVSWKFTDALKKKHV